MRRASTRSRILRGAAYTVGDLLGGLVIAVAVGGLVDSLRSMIPLVIARSLAILISVMVLLLAMRVWTQHMARINGDLDETDIRWSEALILAGVLASVGVVLGLAEPLAVERGAVMNLRIDQVYTLLFVPATFLVCATGAFLIARKVRSRASATKFAILCALASSAVFLAVDLTMDYFGWRVGAPGAARRATMIVVTAIGAAFAAITAGGIIGSLEPARAGSTTSTTEG